MQTATKLEFCKLINLLDVSYEEETKEQRERWMRNVLNSVGSEGMTLDCAYDYNTKMFSANEVEFVAEGEVDLYVFCGSAYEEERFYNKDAFIVKERATGDYYALVTDELYDV
jgi:hypothetical protein